MYKSRLLELCQGWRLALPKYETVGDGPSHMPRFTVAVTVHEQELCQGWRLALPKYETVGDGPSHMPRFTAAVTVHELVFEIPLPSKSTKEAQETAAQIAFEYFSTLPSRPTPSHGKKIYKSRWQELCQGWRLALPKYEIVGDGPIHMPRFIAAVTVHGQVFETPLPSKSTKEAQETAAQIAFEYFSTLPSRPTPSHGNLYVLSF
ncbi:Double-stranded RNA-binding protein 3 [Striga hermonthica]|uniref:Double-stranded RNA-binding protein 3 n=1 Tax=Striga hermonthica TaxID=68872 RepID=A0A9N7NLF5_STRHE|nr:Double-stranded RNA-binding protein 3 [Striga hermonthica]